MLECYHCMGTTTLGKSILDRSGRYVITGSDDRLVKIWSMETAYSLASCRGHDGDITDLTVSSHNAAVASSSNDCIIRVWRLPDGLPISVLRGHTGAVTTIAFSPRPKAVHQLLSHQFRSNLSTSVHPSDAKVCDSLTPTPPTTSPALKSVIGIDGFTFMATMIGFHKGFNSTNVCLSTFHFHRLQFHHHCGKIDSSLYVAQLQHFKHISSGYKGSLVTCLVNKRVLSRNSSSHLPASSTGLKTGRHLGNKKLTASTFAAAIGFWRRRRSQLWLEKIGAIEPFSGNLATCWSNIKEEEALERYKLITGNSVLFPEFQVYTTKPKDSWLAASPDGIIDRMVYELPSHGVLEVKCPYFGGDMRKAFPWSRIPVHYIPQAQGLMEILGRDWMDFYVWTVNGSSLFRLYRDEEYWDVMKIALSDFWWKNVKPARELYTSGVITDPLFQLKSLSPAPRRELCRDIVYKSKLIVDNSKLLIREINDRLIYPAIGSESLV
ncbi:WD40 domain-containing protein [Trifolium repens]|nr:WD40 domain-containing protein [Trifolium repens]